MKWFDKWFAKKCKYVWDHSDQLIGQISKIDNYKERAMPVESDPHSLHDGLKICIKKVVGGSLVTFRTYDRKIDRSEDITYIIPSDTDFNSELAKIITLESMR